MVVSITQGKRGDIAIVGMAVRLPGAGSLAAYWDNLRDGIGSIRHLDTDALIAAGEQPDRIADPNYVAAAAPLDDFADFDAEFFGFGPREAAILDPQHRKFLEVAWEAMEDAGHPPGTQTGRVGVYAGCGMGSYFYFNICSNPDLVDDVGMFLLRHTGNDKDFLSTRVSHVFDLRGPSINIQTACSTSLVAVHYACAALRDGECDMALAGGVTIELPQGRGYLYKENEILSPDGQCHAFDHRAQGTVFGSGAGAVALRRLEDAIADGDHIWAVIKGSAINNDGAAKAGYLAPSVDGQAEAVSMAMTAARVAPGSVDYVECHGTGTYLGDPIEVSALTQAFGDGDRAAPCRIGSVKTNIGHLDTAAGVASLIKVALALHHRQMPPSLGYEAPNPAIDFENGPFRVNDRLTDWPDPGHPRRAGVNSLGVGGTNAHVVLEQAPEPLPSEASDFPNQILCLSGRNRAALDANGAALAAWLRAHPDADLADVAHTLKSGRHAFAKRRVLVAETAAQAAELLEANDPRRVFTHDRLGATPELVFMFPGGGAQFPDMARDLYETEPVFAEWMDRGLDHLQTGLDYDIRALWLPEPGARDEAARRLTQPSVQLPLIMIVEYALAQLWIGWGVRPAALVGHSMGENTAACLAGVMSFEDCIDLVLLRGRLFDTVPAGGMLSISLPLAGVQALIGIDLDIASLNAPDLTAVSGPQGALDRLSAVLSDRQIDHQRIQIDIAAHSRMLDPILAQYRAFLARIPLNPPQMPVISNRSGVELTDEQATSPDYWVDHLRHTVRFADCIATLAQVPGRVFLEVGPGRALSSLAQMNPGVGPGQVLATLRHPDHQIADDAHFLGVIGRLWACGVNADWAQIRGAARRNLLPLPNYAFQSSRYFIEPGRPAATTVADTAPMRDDNLAAWGWRPSWTPRLAECDLDIATELRQEPHNWLIFEDDTGTGTAVADRLGAAGHMVTRVRPGDTFARLAEDRYVLAPEQGRAGYDALLLDLAEAGRLPDRIAHFWLVTGAETFRPGSSFHDRNLEHGLFGLTALAQALGGIELPGPLHLSVITTGAAQTRTEPLPYPEKATIAGPLGVMPREMPGITCASLDIELPVAPAGGWLARWRGADTAPAQAKLTDRLLQDLMAPPANSRAAWRGDLRMVQGYRPVALAENADTPVFRQGGTYLITGGFGGIGLTVAADLMRRQGANVVLLSRGKLPPESGWKRYLKMHGPADPVARRIRALRDLQAIGQGAAMAVVADVANIGQMRAALAQAETRFGALTGVIHAAGEIADAPLLAKTEGDMQRVFTPKAAGLRVLDTLFPDGTLDLMVLFSSTSTATRPAGQVDYIAANEYLDAFARSRRGGATRVCAIDWGVWTGVGMAATAMDARRGGSGPTAMEPAGQPLLDQAGWDADGNRLFRSDLSAGNRWVLDEHRLADGTALMPGTGYLEIAAQALQVQGVDTPYEIRNLDFLRVLRAPDTGSTEMITRLKPTARGYDFSVHSRTPAVDGYVLNAEADIVLPTHRPAPTPIDLGAIAARCGLVEKADRGQRLHSPQEAHLRFGPRWQVLRETALGQGEGLATLVLMPDFAAETRKGMRLHPGLLDLATGWAMRLVPSYDDAQLWVPLSYHALRVLAPLPSEIRSWVRLERGLDAADGFAGFDVIITDSTGRICVEVEGFRMKRLDGALDLSAAAPDASAADLGLVARDAATRLSGDEKRLHHNINQGIRPDEGPEALRRALALGLPQVVVSSLDLPALIAQADHVAAPASEPGHSFDRPDLDTDYVEPGTDLERQLASWFEKLLGVSRVGTMDSFFDLGGHSLIAVRLFAQIRRALDVDFPISVLFEAPNVAALAALITARTGTTDAPATAAATDPGQSEPRQHLVALQKAPGADRTPLFIVAGMFGNVLNLRHLALMLGRDRPVWGLQREAAADYIAEMRQIQPQGPYLLAGFSGGGIAAYEMAQQLHDAGQQVALLAMLDTPLPVRPYPSRQDRALIKLTEFRRKGFGYLREWATNRLRWEIDKRRAAPAATGEAPVFNNSRIEAAFRHAVAAYPLRPWAGPLVLFRPPLDRHWKVSGGGWVSAAKEYVLDDNGWTDWAPQTRVIEVPGDHDSMVLMPNVSVLAEEMNRCIARTETPGAIGDGCDTNDLGWPIVAAAE
jgi:acyl transferase domain-containing protein/thioesterase domain-containing protein/acyl carrier protein